MKAYVGVTDYYWFDLLRNTPGLDEVNFWQPGGDHIFKALKPRELFLFKLHYSHGGKIVGGGIFAHSNIMSINLAWESFGEKNGARSLFEMHQNIAKFKSKKAYLPTDFNIGCILLEQPFFLPESEWIPAPPDWKHSIVQGKTYDLSIEPGLSLWKQLHVSTLLASVEKESQFPLGIAEEKERYGTPTTIYPRLGQGSFRVLVTDLYQRRCAVTREKTLPALDAAHIKPYVNHGEHAVNNGILLRRDLHALFDQRYVTITPSMTFEVSHKIKEEFENGHDYYHMQGTPLWLSSNPANRPSQDFIKWHNENKYLG